MTNPESWPLTVAEFLALWRVWLYMRLRLSASGCARRDFQSATQRLDSDHLWLARDGGMVFSRSCRRVAGFRTLIVCQYRLDDFYATVRDGSAPIASHSYALTPLFLHVLRRSDLERHTMTGELIDRAGTLRDIAHTLHQISTWTFYATPAELHDLTAQISTAAQWARKPVR